MIVDAHVHILPDRVRDNLDHIMQAEPWFGACHARDRRVASTDSLIATMDRLGVDRAVCLGWPFAAPALCAESNDFLAAACRRHPERLVGFGIVQPADPAAAQEVTRCARLGLRGIGEVNADAQGWDIDDSNVAAAVRASTAAGLPWTLHCSEPVGHAYPGKGSTTPDRVVAFADRHPDLTLIAAHLGGGLPLLAHIPEVRATCERLYFDTAAQPFVYDPSVYRAIVDAIGADRLLLGTDHPLLDLPRYQRALDDATLTSAEQALILGATATRLFNL